MATNEREATKVITGLVRFSYVHVWEPQKVNETDDKAKYSVSLIIPKSDKKTLLAFKNAIEEAKKLGINSKWGGKAPANLKMPLRDGDEERPDDEVYANAMFINANCVTQPGVVNMNRNPITEQTEFYSGCYGYASVNLYPFNSNGNKGIACGLNNLMKAKDGEPLGGRETPENDFADLPTDSLAEDEDF